MNSGKKWAASSAGPGSRDRLILDDVVRYHLITNDWIHSRHLPEVKLNAIVKITGRLCREGWLTPHKLFRRRQYFTAGHRLVRQRGIPAGRTQALGPQSLAVHYTAMRYCMARLPGGVELNIASQDEVKRTFPWLQKSFLDRRQVLTETNSGTDWRLLRIDMGGRPDHVARKIQRDLQLLIGNAAFQDLLDRKNFTQVVLCPSQMKKRLVEQSLSERTWPTGIKFQIGFVPELFQLLATT